jgi:hypothetical protein
MQLPGSDPVILIDCIQSAGVDDDSLNSATAVLRTRLGCRGRRLRIWILWHLPVEGVNFLSADVADKQGSLAWA